MIIRRNWAVSDDRLAKGELRVVLKQYSGSVKAWATFLLPDCTHPLELKRSRCPLPSRKDLDVSTLAASAHNMLCELIGCLICHFA